MKPHPRIRKTVKWGGAAVTVALASAGITSQWRYVSWCSTGGGVVVSSGTVFVCYEVQAPGYLAPPGWYTGSNSPPTPRLWWPVGSAYRAPWNVCIPLWLPTAVALVITLTAFRLDHLARFRARLNLCPKCNYDRTGLAPGAVCPECGQASVT